MPADRHPFEARLGDWPDKRFEGVLRERFFVGDQATDSELFGLLAQEWRNRPR